MLFSSCLTSFLQYGKVGLNRIIIVSKFIKYQSPFIDDFGSYSSDFSKMVTERLQEGVFEINLSRGRIGNGYPRDGELGKDLFSGPIFLPTSVAVAELTDLISKMINGFYKK